MGIPSNLTVSQTTRTPPVLPAALLLAAVFFLTGHDFDTSREEAFTSTAEEMEEMAAGGDTARRAGFLLLGGFGLLLLTLPAPRRFDLRSGAAVSLVAFLAWCGLSLAWSSDPSMTARRLAVLACFALGAAGMARQYGARGLTVVALLVSTAFLGLGVAAEVSLGTFQPFSPDYRFAGTLHPNTQGLNLAILSLAAFCLLGTSPESRVQSPEPESRLIDSRLSSHTPRPLLLVLFATGLAFLILTRSRTALAGLLLACGLVWSARTPLSRTAAVGLTGIWLLATLALGTLMSGVDLERSTAGVVLLGRQNEAGTLTGRLPLWTELLPYAEERLLTGHGYASFWNAGHIDEVSTQMGWGLREAHSAYLDSLLAVGLVGTALLLVSVLAALFRSRFLYQQTGGAGHGFVFGWLCVCLVGGITESAMTMPMYATFVAACGIGSRMQDDECPTTGYRSRRRGSARIGHWTLDIGHSSTGNPELL